MSNVKKETRVFILYAGKDTASVEMRDKLKILMMYEGIKYADYQELATTPEERLKELNESIKGTETIILLLSEKYFLSHYCQDEIRIIMNKFNTTKFIGQVFIYSELKFLEDNFYNDNHENFINKTNKFIDEHVKNKLSSSSTTEDRKKEFGFCTVTNRNLIEKIKESRTKTFVYTESNFNQLVRDVAQMDKFKQSPEGSEYLKSLTQQKKNQTKDKIFTLARGQGHHIIIVAHSKTEKLDKESIQKSIHIDTKTNTFNTKHLYNSFEAVKLWKYSMNNPTVNQKAHRNKDEAEFIKFLVSDFWKDAKLNIDRVVKLGVGTGEKTVKIIQSLDTSKKNINIVLVDASLNMIKESFNTVKEMKADELNGIDGLDGLDADFMNFDNEHKTFMQGADSVDLQNRTAFFMLGGTLCNLHLDNFINSIKNVMIEGDYLIVGIHIFEKEPEKVEKDALDTYDIETLEKIFSFSLSEFDVKIKELIPTFENIDDVGGVLKFNAKLLITGDDKDKNNNIVEDQYYPLIQSTRYKLSYIKSYFTDSKVGAIDNEGNPDGKGDFVQRIVLNSDETAYIAFEYKG